VLALSFLLLIGISLVADGLGQHIPKGYIYLRWASRLRRNDQHPVQEEVAAGQAPSAVLE